MPKPLGSKNFSYEEGERLAELAAQGVSKVDAAKALRRSYWVVMRHSASLGIVFAHRGVATRVSKEHAGLDLAAARALRRRLEDGVIQELARSGWSQGMAALELDLDFSALSRHSKRLGVTWTRYPNRSIEGLARIRSRGAAAVADETIEGRLIEDIHEDPWPLLGTPRAASWRSVPRTERFSGPVPRTWQSLVQMPPSEYAPPPDLAPTTHLTT